VLVDLRRRLAQAKWPDQLPATTWEYGADMATIRKLADYWEKKYDWRKQEARITRFEQFTTEIDGQRIHFIHQRSPLTNPKDSNTPAFHVIIPSLPGVGFSGPTKSPSWGARRMAKAFILLMDHLGYSRYGIQGGDWGSFIGQYMAHEAPKSVIGLHSNFLPVPPPNPEALSELSAVERERYTHFEKEEYGYFKLQSTKPQTPAYALTDSPLGWLAWIAEKFQSWTDNGGDFLTVVDRDAFFTNLTLYWATGTVGSSLGRKSRTASPPLLQTYGGGSENIGGATQNLERFFCRAGPCCGD
jgi:epoxide hydrolase